MSRSRMISFEDFARVDIRVGRIVEAERFPEARKPAFKLRIDFGPELGVKKSSAQLTTHYQPDDLIGRLVLAVVNFPPRQIGPFMSEVLTLGVPDPSGAVVLAVPEREVPLGGRLFWHRRHRRTRRITAAEYADQRGQSISQGRGARGQTRINRVQADGRDRCQTSSVWMARATCDGTQGLARQTSAPAARASGMCSPDRPLNATMRNVRCGGVRFELTDRLEPVDPRDGEVDDDDVRQVRVGADHDVEPRRDRHPEPAELEVLAVQALAVGLIVDKEDQRRCRAGRKLGLRGGAHALSKCRTRANSKWLQQTEKLDDSLTDLRSTERQNCGWHCKTGRWSRPPISTSSA